jgi:hypothetical protein
MSVWDADVSKKLINAGGAFSVNGTCWPDNLLFWARLHIEIKRGNFFHFFHSGMFKVRAEDLDYTLEDHGTCSHHLKVRVKKHESLSRYASIPTWYSHSSWQHLN